MMVLKRKQVVITIIICMVLVAGYINWAYQSSVDSRPASEIGKTQEQGEQLGEAALVNAGVAPTPEPTKGPESEAIKQAKDSRNTARSKAMELLKETVNNPSTSKENKDKAQTELTVIATAMEKEGICEGVLATKGLEESVVFISNGNITVTVKSPQELNSADITKIKDVIITNTSCSADKIKISSVK